MAHFHPTVNLSELPHPEVIELLDYEQIVTDMLNDLKKRDTTFTALLESDPACKILQVCAYRELLLRQRINEAARGVMLAFAKGTDLDQIAANFNIKRHRIEPSTKLKFDGDLRTRTLNAIENVLTLAQGAELDQIAAKFDIDLKRQGSKSLPPQLESDDDFHRRILESIKQKLSLLLESDDDLRARIQEKVSKMLDLVQNDELKFIAGNFNITLGEGDLRELIKKKLEDGMKGVGTELDKQIAETFSAERLWKQDKDNSTEPAKTDQSIEFITNLLRFTEVEQLVSHFGFEQQRMIHVDEWPMTLESDDELRNRVQKVFDGLTNAGTRDAYISHTLNADGRIADASAISPSPGQVLVSVLAREGNGRASKDLIDTVEAKLNTEEIRPLTDQLIVKSAVIQPYTIFAWLYLESGPEAESILKIARARALTYAREQRRLGRHIRQSAIYAMLHVPGVQNVKLILPEKDVNLAEHDVNLVDTKAAYCDAILLIPRIMKPPTQQPNYCMSA
ncbi:baseplate assembly protein [Candidatus Regiella insecticola]|uniref:Baseplate assembly protein n=1 Tax=Candidatus Regiella insecticola TaxID=138073 RepID=A0A6L2ZSF9_9ENTR|nr:baseplate J/gp47 family protein [Candidatus Regiella insecticola]GFN47420.1 baseplate assembly protein [Candidatus Regiella insecticola]